MIDLTNKILAITKAMPVVCFGQNKIF